MTMPLPVELKTPPQPHSEQHGDMVWTTTYACERCGGEATHAPLYSERFANLDDDIFNARLTRQTYVVVYACVEHAHELSRELVEEWGSAFTCCAC